MLVAGLTERGAKCAIERLPVELVVRFSVADLLSYEESLVEFNLRKTVRNAPGK